jgi:GntR family transcriptional regulator
MKNARKREPVELIADAFVDMAESRLAKHVRLYDAIAMQIDAEHLVSGDKLPGERELCVATGLSLGTVQKSLSMLVTDGRIVREHGRGTFIRGGRLPMRELWHYRFRDPQSGQLLAAYAHLVAREHVGAEPSWRDALGVDLAGYVRIVRTINIADRFKCWSEMYLPFSRFRGLLDLPRAEIESVNLKQVLAARFGAPTLATAQTVILRPFPPKIAKELGVKAGSQGLLLNIVGSTRGGVPISFQRIHVPSSECELEVGADVTAITASIAA